MKPDLYLDDSIDAGRLRRVLRGGAPFAFRVVSPSELGRSGQPDAEHVAFARREGLAIITKNPGDFEALHWRTPDHPGIFAVYLDNRPSDVSPDEIARAIQNILDAGVALAGRFHILNHRRY